MDRVTGTAGSANLTLCHALAVRLGHPDLDAVERLLSGLLGMPVLERTPSLLRLDNGSLCLWFHHAPGCQPDPLRLVLAAPDVPRAVDELMARRDVEVVTPPRFVTPERLEAELRIEGWLAVSVGRTFDEDELGVVPALHTELAWDSSAEALLKALLRSVPVAFRQVARLKSVARAEEHAAMRGEVCVTRDDAVRALVDVTPRFQHALLRDVLRAAGERELDLVPLFSHLEATT